MSTKLIDEENSPKKMQIKEVHLKVLDLCKEDEASVNPGDCWAFHGSFGNVRIRLAEPVIITSFSLYHIPKQLSPTGKIKSAPRNFSVVVSLFFTH
ncbi:hypothetical protein J437_LFUL006719 [Ladona fulva]|uniref:SUN domain-containing protein n=1 Tax=Ladona fulva TaxID=123851 RepID=A0A8K0NU18_LADFU|nr:hypothetical protein J437_LFUL006719 [Ladona fulva]